MTEKTIFLPPHPAGNGHGNGDANYRLTVMVPKRRYFSYLRERWWLVVVCVALTLGAWLVYETLRPDLTTSYAQLYASGEVQLTAVNLLNEESLTYFGTQVELLKSARLQNAALEKSGYVAKPGELAPVRLEIIQPLKTSILELQTTGSDPNLTQRFLQALINEYLAYKKETRRSTSEEIMLSLTDQVTQKEDALKVEQEKWALFQRTNNVGVLEQESKSAGLYLAELNLQLAKLKLDHELLAKGLSLTVTNGSAPNETLLLTQTNAAQDAATNAAGPVGPAFYSSFAAQLSTDAALKSAKFQLALSRADRDQMRADRGAAAARRLDDEVARMERTVSILEQQNLAEQKANLEELEKRITAMEASIPSWEAKVLNMNERLAEGERLKNNIQREQGYYDHLLVTLQNVDLGKNVQQERLSVLQPPTAAQPVKRHMVLGGVLSVLFGLCLSLGLMFGWYLLDDRFVSVRDIKDQFGEMVLGLVPQIRVAKSKPQQALLDVKDSRQVYAESYRHLRSALLFSSFGQNRPQALLITSSAPGEGKTTIALNLARLLARSGLRVALVDADARMRGLTSLLDAKEQVGVLDFLRGEAAATAIQHPTGIEGLSFIPVGTHSELSEGAFLRPQLADLMRELRQDRDFVIVDGAPILASDDAALLVPLVDAVVMVTRPFYTRSRLIRQSLDMLYQRQAKSVSFIHNRARADDLAGHYEMNGQTSPGTRKKA